MPINTPGDKQLKLIDDKKKLDAQLFDEDLSLKDAIVFAFAKSKDDANEEMKKLDASKMTPEAIDEVTRLVTSKLAGRIAFAIDEYIKETIVDIDIRVNTQINGQNYSGDGKATSKGTS